MEVPTLLIPDATVLINFLCVDRLDLMAHYPAHVLISEHVSAEIARHYPEQVARLKTALAANPIQETALSNPAELATMARIRAESRNRLAFGECSAIAVALHRNCELAIDDKAAVRHITAHEPQLKIHSTHDLIVALIRTGALDVSTADGMKDTWEAQFRVQPTIRRFSDIPWP